METGDVVYLKEEDRLMTVEKVVDDLVHCRWFEGSDLHGDAFTFAQLERKRT